MTKIKINFTLLITLLFATSSFAIESDNELISINKNYFALGDRQTPIKLELGFKQQLFTSGNFFFGYHQKNFWDINNGSSPVLDSNYNPQFFYKLADYQGIKWTFGIIEHLSNGGSNERSRGTNMSYLHGFKQISTDKMNVDVSFKLFASYKKDDGSPDINEYMGIWALMIRLSSFLPIELKHSLDYRTNAGGKWGTDYSKGSHEFNLMIQPTTEANFAVFLQYFVGRNEYLLKYKTYHEASRIGISLLF